MRQSSGALERVVTSLDIQSSRGVKAVEDYRSPRPVGISSDGEEPRHYHWSGTLPDTTNSLRLAAFHQALVREDPIDKRSGILLPSHFGINFTPVLAAVHEPAFH